MELHQLRYFLAVARLGHFTRAAAECGVAQPSLSHQIQKLEEEMGQKLVVRQRGGATLTPAGEVLARHAARVLEEVALTEEAAHALRGETQARLRVGAIPTIAPHVLPGVLSALLDEFPALELAVEEDVTIRLFERLIGGQLDVVIASQAIAPKDSDYQAQRLFKEPLLLAVPARHPLARRPKVMAEDLAGARLILLNDAHCLTGSVRAFCDKNNLPGHVVCRGAQLESVLAMVACGMGVSLIPRMACARRWSPGVVFVALADAKPTREIMAYWPSGTKLGAPVKKLLGLLGEEAFTSRLPPLPVRPNRL